MASFALQDTIQAVIRHYSRFAPHEKTAMAADVLNQVWKASTRTKKNRMQCHNLSNATPPVGRQLFPISTRQHLG
jgi:hypothetical protein